MSAFCVGIAGPTASGKSTFAEVLKKALDEDLTVVFEMDWYYKNISPGPGNDYSEVNFDHPDAIDINLAVQQLQLLRDGNAVQRPQYSFQTHQRLQETVTLEPAHYILVEGLYPLHFPEIRHLLHYGIFLYVPPEICLARRMKRDIEQRGRDAQAVIRQYTQHVVPMAEAFVLPSQSWADLTLYQTDFSEDDMKQIAHTIQGTALSEEFL